MEIKVGSLIPFIDSLFYWIDNLSSTDRFPFISSIFLIIFMIHFYLCIFYTIMKFFSFFYCFSILEKRKTPTGYILLFSSLFLILSISVLHFFIELFNSYLLNSEISSKFTYSIF